MVSSSCCSYCYFLLKEVIPLLQCGVPSMGDSPLKTPQCETFLQATILHKLLPPAVVLPWVQSFKNSLLQCGFPTGSEVLPADLLLLGLVHGLPGPARSLLQCGPPMESELSQDSSRTNRLFWSETDECSDINYLTLFIFLTKKVKMMNSVPHKAQKSSQNLRKSTLKVSNPSQVQVDCR